MQLFSKTDPAKAVTQVTTIRGQTMATLPPEMAPADLVAALLATSGSSGTTPALPTSTGSPVNPTAAAGAGNSLVAVNSDGLVSIDDSVIKRYGLLIVCLLAGNLLLTIALIIFAVFTCVRRGTSKRSTRTSPPTYVPVKNGFDHQDEEFVGNSQRPYSH
jgi:saccharopepsin